LIVQLSVLDLIPLPSGATSGQALRNSLALAGVADRLGYTRYWFAEHHNMPTIASTTPEIMIALVAEATRGIRVGSGGVMLPNHQPLKVAETYKMLEALYPGRIDLGIGRAPGTDQATALALRGSYAALEADDFPAKLAELMAYGRGNIPAGHALASIAAIPVDVPLPPVWLLGSSQFSARLSAALGLGYGFAAHFSDLPAEVPMRAYREQWNPEGIQAKPHAILTLSVICAPSDEEARLLGNSLLVAFTRLRTGQTTLLLSPEEAAAYPFTPRERMVAEALRGMHIMGSPKSVKARIEPIAEHSAADEVMITTFTYGQAERIRSYELLAEAFAMEPRAAS
jgi:luciferase family oxidoreductase group 1